MRLKALAQVGLGLFIVWQLYFLLVSDLLYLADPPSQKRPASERNLGDTLLDLCEQPSSSWADLTGQLYGWSLYAPGVSHESFFFAVDLRWDDADEYPPKGGQTARQPSDTEPADPRHYYRPFCTARILCYEGSLLIPPPDEKTAANPERLAAWRKFATGMVRRKWKSYRSYLQWRLQRFQEANPGEPPPRQLILVLRQYHISAPGEPWSWEGPVEQPMIRWRLEVQPPAGEAPIELYDPLLGRFVGVSLTEDKAQP